MAQHPRSTDGRQPRAYQPSPEEVRRIIDSASAHPLGTEFLVSGALDSVAATFEAHAFAVDAARESIRKDGASPEIRTAKVGGQVGASAASR